MKNDRPERMTWEEYKEKHKGQLGDRLGAGVEREQLEYRKMLDEERNRKVSISRARMHVGSKQCSASLSPAFSPCANIPRCVRACVCVCTYQLAKGSNHADLKEDKKKKKDKKSKKERKKEKKRSHSDMLSSAGGRVGGMGSEEWAERAICEGIIVVC